jgi:hypothetical protein
MCHIVAMALPMFALSVHDASRDIFVAPNSISKNMISSKLRN